MVAVITILQFIQSGTNLWWKFLLSSKKTPRVSWLITAIDTGLFALISLYFELYQLLAFELFFMFVAIGLFSKKLHKLHCIVLAFVIFLIYVLNTINPLTTLEFIVVIFFILAVYFWANKKKQLGWIFIFPGHLLLCYVLFSKGVWIMGIAQAISLVLAIRGIKNSKPVPLVSNILHI